jgi:hypothetical protein
MRTILFLFALTFLRIYSCKAQEFVPPGSVFHDSARYVGLYDSAKWLAYCIHCDDKIKGWGKYAGLPQVYLGELSLRYDYSIEKGDTVEFFFHFYYDTVRCDVNSLANYGMVLNGVAFSKRRHKKIYYIRGDAYIQKTDRRSRYVKELQPEVVRFIRDNKNNLDPWFGNEARRRGVLQ